MTVSRRVGAHVARDDGVVVVAHDIAVQADGVTSAATDSGPLSTDH